jgi:thymidylate kinase
MKVVELCGPTGAGKSTIYEAIQQMIVSEGLTDKFCDGYTNEELDGTKIDVTPQLEPFIKLLDKTFKEAYGPRLEKRAQGTAKAMTKIIRAHRENDSRTMVIDGGLIHRAQGIHRFIPPQPVPDYLGLMPTPELTVMVEADLETLKDRNRLRGGSHDRTFDSERSMVCCDMARKILDYRGARILDIDGRLPAEQNAKTIIQAILDMGDQVGDSRKYTGKVAEEYDEKRQDQPKYLDENAIIERWLGELPPGTKVLDCPVGTGRFVAFHEEHGFNVICMDLSQEMIEQAQKKGSVVKNDYVIGDAQETGLPDDVVNVAMMIRLTRWLTPDGCVKALKEMQRVATDKVIFTARVRNSRHVRGYDLIESALTGWKITRDEGLPGDDNYRVIMLEPA